MLNPNIKDKSCILLHRCSSRLQGTSIDNQGRTTEGCIAANNLIVVGEVILEGVSGSVPGNRKDVDEIIARKKGKNDFDLLVVTDTTRFTRAGLGHGQKLVYELRAAGIQVYFVTENLLIDNEQAEMYASFLFSASNQQAKAIARGATVGNTNSFLDGRSAYTQRPPLGIDRMISCEGRDLYIIRNLTDGTQQMIDPNTHEILRTFGRNPDFGTPVHYVKQKNERVRLIPGATERIATVHLIHTLYHLKKVSPYRIAMRLNDSQIKSPIDMEWTATTVIAILRNPAYIGRGIRYRKETGIYFLGGEANAVPSKITMEDLAKSANIKHRLRQRRFWKERSMPELQDFLPEEVRDLSAAYVERHLERVADGKVPQIPHKDRHDHSLFLLKHIMKTKEGQHPMTGRNSGRKNNITRYYAVNKGDKPKKNNTLKLRIRADVVEAAVLEELKRVLLDRPTLSAAMNRAIASVESVKDNVDDMDQMKKELQRKSRQISVLSDSIGYGEDADGPVLRKIEELRTERKRIEAQIKLIETVTNRVVEPAVTVEKLTARLEELAGEIRLADTALLRTILEIFVVRCEADLKTKDVELDLAVPSWMGEVISSGRNVGLEELQAYAPLIEAHPEKTQILGQFTCSRVTTYPRCYSCARRSSQAKAA